MPDEKLARAVRSKVRREILNLLCEEKKASVHETAERMKITESSASKHLKLLHDLGFIGFEEKPPEKIYFLKIKEMEEFLAVYNKVVEKMG